MTNWEDGEFILDCNGPRIEEGQATILVSLAEEYELFDALSPLNRAMFQNADSNLPIGQTVEGYMEDDYGLTLVIADADITETSLDLPILQETDAVPAAERLWTEGCVSRPEGLPEPQPDETRPFRTGSREYSLSHQEGPVSG